MEWKCWTGGHRYHTLSQVAKRAGLQKRCKYWKELVGRVGVEPTAR
jgi:hypothetical protein